MRDGFIGLYELLLAEQSLFASIAHYSLDFVLLAVYSIVEE